MPSRNYRDSVENLRGSRPDLSNLGLERDHEEDFNMSSYRPRPRPTQSHASQVLAASQGGGTSGISLSPASAYSATLFLDRNKDKDKDKTKDKEDDKPKPDRQDSLGEFPDHYKFDDNKHVSAIFEAMQNMYESQLLCDVTLVVEDEDFPCHRCMLAACSPYFQAMFTSDLAESRQSKVHIHGIDAPSMKIILDFCYSSKVEINETNVQGLLLAVNMFQMNNLRDACARFLERHVTLGNCIGIYFFASAHECERLTDLAKDLICENFTDVSKEEEFLQLTKDRIVDLISRDELNVDREETVFEAVMAWVKHDIEVRRCDLLEIVSHVRFALISPYYIHDVIGRDRLIAHNKSCQHLIDSALQYHVLRDRRQDLDLTKINTNTRKGMPVKDLFVFLTHHAEDMPKESTTSELYKIKSLPDMIECAECVVTGENNIFVAGRQPPDYTNRRVFSSRRGGLFQYDHFDRKWLPRAAMNTQRSLFSMTVLDGMVYATGGLGSEGELLNSVEFYNPSTNNWRFTSPMLHGTKAHGVAAVGGMLYVIGGENLENTIETMQCYNPRVDSWSTLGCMILPRSYAGVTVFQREIYVIGGTVAVGERHPENMLKSVEIFNPDRNEWRFGPELPEGRFNFTVVTFNGSIYVFGGETGGEEPPDNKVFRLDNIKHGWQEDKSAWPLLQTPFNAVVARMNKDA
ncbi:kelch-like protein 24 [Amphiura filiformis]|uniref:kelch-like protein 24 n=1 Tax=Amphiura filiformis TaxID=82378 RepID=UPI003B21ECF5